MQQLGWLAVLATVVSTTSFAHHSRLAFNHDKTIQFVGVITEVGWSNPHLYYKAQVPNKTGGLDEWTFEGGNLSNAQFNGWHRDSVQKGDHVVIEAYVHLDPTVKYAVLEHVTLTSTGDTFPSRNQPMPDWLEPSKDFSGTWVLTDLSNRSREHLRAPEDLTQLTALGKAQLDSLDVDNDPYFRCIDIPAPRVALASAGFHFTRSGKTLDITHEYSKRHRLIHMDGAPMPARFKPDRDGWSVGHVEPDGTLIVETSGFAPTPWGIAIGLDSSARKHAVERYTLDDNGLGISVSYTITDPVYLTAPYTVTGHYKKVVDYKFPAEPACDPKTASRFPISRK